MAALPFDVPVTVGRGEAARAAREELARQIYHADDPTLVQQAARWLVREVGELLGRAAEVAPGGYAGLLVLLALLLLVVVVVRLRVGPLARAGGTDTTLFAGRPRSADEHRRAAEQHAQAGRWDEAVRERLRALVRDLEQRGLIEPRPGRTADEAAAEAGRVLPGHAEALRTASRTFDDVWYGGRPATPPMYATLSDLDEQVRRTRPAPVGAPT